MSARAGRHQDPHSAADNSMSSQRRSCTPDADEQRGFAGSTGAVQLTPHKDGSSSPANARHLMVKYKSLINDVVVALGNPVNLSLIDDFIALTEDGLRALRTTKVDSRATLRRLQSNPLPLSRREEPEVPTTPQPHPPGPAAPQSQSQDAHTPTAEGSSQKPTTKSYMAALRGRSAVSPMKAKPIAQKVQELEKRAQELPTEKLVEARDTSALRSEERQRQAEERRKERQDERIAKLEEGAEKAAQAKQRREAAQEKMRVDTTERHEGAVKRADDCKVQVKEKAQKTSVRVEEVLFVQDMQQKNKQLKLEMKMSDAEQNHEQRREEVVRQLKERHEAVTAVVERQRDLSQQRAEKQQQREAQRLENLKRLEEQKRLEYEQKHQKAEEREKKVQQQLQVAQAEAEARKAKSEERIQQSVQLREEQREKQKQKLEQKEQKLKELKERREGECNTSKPSLQELMPSLSAAEEEALQLKLARSQTTCQRQGKAFTDQYQKESTMSAKDVNRSRLRAIFARITPPVAAPGSQVAPVALTTCRQPLREVSTGELNDVDHEFIRFSNGFESIVRVFVESRKANDLATLRLCSDALHRLLTDKDEGSNHTKYFVRAGHHMPLILLVHDEIKTMKKHNLSVTLTCLMSIISICISGVMAEAQVNPKLASTRDQMLEVVGLDRFCFAVASACSDEEETPCLQYALLIVYNQLMYLSRKKSECATTTPWLSAAVTALFTLLQNILTPGGQPLRAQAVLSASTLCVIFTALRILTTIARWKLDSLQDFLRGGAERSAATPNKATPAAAQPSSATTPNTPDSANPAGATRHELFHIVHSFFQYVATHDETLERLPPSDATAEGAARSFIEALQFGITVQHVPRIPLPSSCVSEANVLVSARGTSVQSNAAEASIAVDAMPAGFLRASLHELLLLIGYITLCDGAMQEVFSWGKDRPLLALMLSSLPVQYFAQCRHILFPTLLSVVHHDDRNLIVTAREMDVSALKQFLQEEFDALPPKVKQQSQAYFEALQEENAKAAQAAAAKAVLPVKLPKKSWADMDDDDDEEIRIPSPGHPGGKSAAAVATSVTAQEKTKAQTEKEKLAKALKSVPSALAHFRFDRRFPVALWVDAITFLAKDLPPPAPVLA